MRREDVVCDAISQGSIDGCTKLHNSIVFLVRERRGSSKIQAEN